MWLARLSFCAPVSRAPAVGPRRRLLVRETAERSRAIRSSMTAWSWLASPEKPGLANGGIIDGRTSVS